MPSRNTNWQFETDRFLSDVQSREEQYTRDFGETARVGIPAVFHEFQRSRAAELDFHKQKAETQNAYTDLAINELRRQNALVELEYAKQIHAADMVSIQKRMAALQLQRAEREERELVEQREGYVRPLTIQDTLRIGASLGKLPKPVSGRPGLYSLEDADESELGPDQRRQALMNLIGGQAAPWMELEALRQQGRAEIEDKRSSNREALAMQIELNRSRRENLRLLGQEIARLTPRLMMLEPGTPEYLEVKRKIQELEDRRSDLQRLIDPELEEQETDPEVAGMLDQMLRAMGLDEAQIQKAMESLRR